MKLDLHFQNMFIEERKTTSSSFYHQMEPIDIKIGYFYHRIVVK